MSEPIMENEYYEIVVGLRSTKPLIDDGVMPDPTEQDRQQCYKVINKETGVCEYEAASLPRAYVIFTQYNQFLVEEIWAEDIDLEGDNDGESNLH